MDTNQKTQNLTRSEYEIRFAEQSKKRHIHFRHLLEKRFIQNSKTLKSNNYDNEK